MRAKPTHDVIQRLRLQQGSEKTRGVVGVSHGNGDVVDPDRHGAPLEGRDGRGASAGANARAHEAGSEMIRCKRRKSNGLVKIGTPLMRWASRIA